MPLVINFPSHFFWHKQTPPLTVDTVETERYLFMWFHCICNLLFFENRPGPKTFSSIMIRDDIMGPLQQTVTAMCCHYCKGLRRYADGIRNVCWTEQGFIISNSELKQVRLRWPNKALPIMLQGTDSWFQNSTLTIETHKKPPGYPMYFLPIQVNPTCVLWWSNNMKPEV